MTRPASNSEARIHESAEDVSSPPVKLDAAAQAEIEKHRYVLGEVGNHNMTAVGHWWGA